MCPQINLAKLFKKLVNPTLKLNLILFTCLIYTPYSSAIGYQNLSPRAHAYILQTHSAQKTALNSLIRATLGLPKNAYDEHAIGFDTRRSLEDYILKNYGAIATRISIINQRKYTEIPLKNTGRFLDTLEPYTRTDLTPRPRIFYHHNVFAEATKVSGADLILGPQFMDLKSNEARRFLVLQAIKSTTLGTPIITNYLSGIKFPGVKQSLPFNQPELDLYHRAAVLTSDVMAASASSELFCGAFIALKNRNIEPIQPDASRPSCQDRIENLTNLALHQASESDAR
jgi:hypothetical protein